MNKRCGSFWTSFRLLVTFKDEPKTMVHKRKVRDRRFATRSTRLELIVPILLSVMGIYLGILSTQFFPRQGPREPCSVPLGYFHLGTLLISVALPWIYMAARRWSTAERLLSLIAAGLTTAFFYYGMRWERILSSSWSELW